MPQLSSFTYGSALAALVSALLLALALPLTASGAGKKPPRVGGNVQAAWPKSKSGKPSKGLGKFLARQVGARKVRGTKAGAIHARAAANDGVRGGTAVDIPDITGKGSGSKLRLVRSFDIPKDDPAYERLLNLSFTYDSALATTAFAATGDRKQAEQLLDQLTALQRKDGSIDFAFDTSDGASDPTFRTGTIAWLGFAIETYHERFKSNRYGKAADRVKDWLVSQQLANGLIRGGPDVSWASSLHNFVAWNFLTDYASHNKGKDSREAAAAAESIEAGIDTELLVADAGGLHFRQGLADDTKALDAQTLGVLYLLEVGRKDEAAAVADYMQANFAIGGRSIVESSDPATYNMTYTAPGPFSGYRPYAGENVPDVLWMEGTLEARVALRELGRDTADLDRSISAWRDVAGRSTGPLMADRTATHSLNEYHVWPVSATASWVLLGGAS